MTAREFSGEVIAATAEEVGRANDIWWAERQMTFAEVMKLETRMKELLGQALVDALAVRMQSVQRKGAEA